MKAARSPGIGQATPTRTLEAIGHDGLQEGIRALLRGNSWISDANAGLRHRGTYDSDRRVADPSRRYFIRCKSASAAMYPNAFQPPPEVTFSNTSRAFFISPVT